MRRLRRNDHYGAYRAAAVRFDGASYLTRGGGLTGAADGKQGIFSVWLKPETMGANGFVLRATDGAFSAVKSSTQRFTIGGTNAALSNILSLQTPLGTAVNRARWFHVLASWDLGAGAGGIYVDGRPETAIVTLTDDTIDYTTTEWSIGASEVGASLLNAGLAELYFNPAAYLDFGVRENRARFRTALNHPVDLGADGSGPTGSPPLIYVRGSDLTANLGSGGNFAFAAGAAAPIGGGPWL